MNMNICFDFLDTFLFGFGWSGFSYGKDIK